MEKCKSPDWTKLEVCFHREPTSTVEYLSKVLLSDEKDCEIEIKSNFLNEKKHHCYFEKIKGVLMQVQEFGELNKEYTEKIRLNFYAFVAKRRLNGVKFTTDSGHEYSFGDVSEGSHRTEKPFPIAGESKK